MTSIRWLICVAALGLYGCGPACLDDRCSIKPPATSTTRVSYAKAAPVPPEPAPSSSSQAPAVVPATDSVPSAATMPPAPPALSAADPEATQAWQLLAGDRQKRFAMSSSVLPADALVRIAFVKLPDKTPFVIILETKPAGAPSAPEAAWNDCAAGEVRCEPSASASHRTKRAGHVLVQVGVNWAVSQIAEDQDTTLVTWTNNLSRETLTLRLAR